jgi:hypothetical protein
VKSKDHSRISKSSKRILFAAGESALVGIAFCYGQFLLLLFDQINPGLTMKKAGGDMHLVDIVLSVMAFNDKKQLTDDIMGHLVLFLGN